MLLQGEGNGEQNLIVIKQFINHHSQRSTVTLFVYIDISLRYTAMGDRGWLSVHDRRQLLKWNPNSDREELHLLYSFNRDGACASTFHDKCDHQGPTYTVLYSPYGSVYGGYTSESWEKGNVYKADATAFLFSLSFTNRRNDLKFPVINTQKAIYCYDSYGPTFGNGYHWIPFWKGYDMFTFEGKLTKNKRTYTLNGYFKFGNTYDMLNKRTDDVTNGSTTVRNLEVYGIRDTGIPQCINVPSLTDEVLETLRKEVVLFQPYNSKVEKANILLLGPIGAGKSSFVNNVDSVFKGRMSYRASTGCEDVSTTITYQAYRFVTGPERKMLRFQLFDTRGLEETTTSNTEDISLILDGYVSSGYIFEPDASISSKIERDAEEPPKLNNRIHCVCFVVDGTTIDDISDSTYTKTQQILRDIRQKGVPVLFLVTKLDKIMLKPNHDMAMLLTNYDVKLIVARVAEMFGAQESHVVITKNYKSEVEVSAAIDTMTLYNVRQMLLAVDDFISNQTLLEDSPGPGLQVSEEGLFGSYE